MAGHAAARHVAALYERHAHAWDQARGHGLMERRWLDRFCALIPAGSPVLDLGCGGGAPIAGHLLGRGHPITGVDTSSRMIELCRRRFPEHDWHRADMRQLALGRRFAGILAWDSFFHLTAADQAAMFEVFRAHAAPGAALMLTSGPAAGTVIGTLEGEPLHHASLAPNDYRRLLEESDFAIVAHIAEDPDCGRHTVWLAKARETSGPAHA